MKNTIICGNCVEVMQKMPDNYIDMTCTSPPYDNLRSYLGYEFNFESIANELFRITKEGGVVVWVVGDATIKGSETGTSFKQALYFKEIGFNLHDTMIWEKPDFKPLTHKRYEQAFEYMFILSKCKIKTFSGIKDKRNVGFGRKVTGTWRDQDGTTKPMSGANTKSIQEFGLRNNIWKIATTKGKNKHPATFPEQLAEDHILSWSNEGDIVLDPMCGSGTTCKMAKKNGRNYIGIDIAEEYCKITRRRIE